MISPIPSQDMLRSTLTRLTQNQNCLTLKKYDHKPKIGLAVSGGPDSMALLWLMQEYYDGAIIAASIDHGLRDEAAQEALYVASICKQLNVEHIILRPEQAIVGNIQSEARKVRYKLLQEWAKQSACEYIATAHHADDQLETLIMRMNRGSGVTGMAGIRERNGNIIRPLLGYRKDTLITVCKDANIDPIDDPSNLNKDFDRVKVRQWLQHQQTDDQTTLLDSTKVAKTALYMQEAEIALQYSVNILANKRIKKQDDQVIINASQLPYEYQRRLLLIGLQTISDTKSPRGSTLENAIKQLNNNNISMIGDIKCTAVRKEKGADLYLWQLTKAPPRRYK